jgi:hypothetical protein
MQERERIPIGALSASLAILFLPGTLVCIWFAAKLDKQWMFSATLFYMIVNALLIAAVRRREKKRFTSLQELNPPGVPNKR